MRTWIKLAALACAFGLAGPASADHDKDTKGRDDKPLTDTTFVDKVVSSNMAEIDLGRIAYSRAQTDDVRRFAARMVQDHSKAYQDLIIIVSEQRIAIPEKCLPEHATHIRHFATAAMTNFDQEYMKHMVESHEKSVDLFTRGTKELKNERLKGYAEKTLPVVQEHLKLAKDLRAKVGGEDARRDAGAATDRPRTEERRTRTDERRDERRDERGEERRKDTAGAAKALTDSEFVQKAASSGKAEVAIGKEGQEKAKNAEVKRFADRIVTDHTKANQELMRAAQEAGISVSEKSADQDEHVKHLRDASNFDKAFADHMVKSHEKGVDMFTKASKELKNEKLRAFAEKTLPTLKEHLRMAKDLQAKVGRDRE